MYLLIPSWLFIIINFANDTFCIYTSIHVQKFMVKKCTHPIVKEQVTINRTVKNWIGQNEKKKNSKILKRAQQKRQKKIIKTTTEHLALKKYNKKQNRSKIIRRIIVQLATKK